MKETYSKLQKYFAFDKQDAIFQSILKSLLLLIGGAFLGAFIRDLSASTPRFNWIFFLIVISALAIFIYLEVRRLKREKNFPLGILDHLTALYDLDELKKRYNRKVKIDEYIDKSIQSLNANTCPVVYMQPENQLCHQDLQAGLRNVIEDFIEKTHYFLDLDKSKFTVGVYLDNIYDPNSKPGDLNIEEKNFLFRDDLKLSDLIPDPLYGIEKENEERFNFQTALIKSYNLSKYLCTKIVVSDKPITLISSPIPNVCENCPADGVIFCVFEGHDLCPTDVENVLLIQGRILSNWVSKFNDCVFKEKRIADAKPHEHKKVLLPKEVDDLLKNNSETKTGN